MYMKNKIVIGVLAVAAAVLLANNLERTFGGGIAQV
jgi:hypothetical protein